MIKTAAITNENGIDALLTAIQFGELGLVPAVIQDAVSKQVLTLCYLSIEALRKSLQEGKVYVFRRSQNKLMLKGEISGHVQAIRQVLLDCEGKSLVILVRQHVAGCHTGFFTCYFRGLSKSGKLKVLGRRVFDPKKVYKTG